MSPRLKSRQEGISFNVSLRSKSEGKVNALSWGKRFDGLLRTWEASLLFVPASLPMSRFTGGSGASESRSQLNEQDLEFCWVLPWLESKGWRPDFLNHLSGPISGPAQVATWQWTLVDLLSAPEVPLWLAPARPHTTGDLWPPSLAAVKVSKGQPSLEIFQAEPLQGGITGARTTSEKNME